MPSSRKKKQSKALDQKNTLHNFFSATPTSKTTNEKSRHSKSRQLKIGPTIDSNIIVIDSDSDDDVEFVEILDVKKRRLSPKGASVCSTSLADQRLLANTNCISNDTTSKSTGGSLVTGSPQHTRSSHSPAFSFGFPFLLVDTNSDGQFQQTKEEATSFGVPHLLCNNGQSASLRVGSSPRPDFPSISSAGPRITPETLDETPVDIDLTLDEWDNGDDEDVDEYGANIDDDVPESELLVLQADNRDSQFGEIRARSDQADVSRYNVQKSTILLIHHSIMTQVIIYSYPVQSRTVVQKE
ncbi:hypothetical protein HYPSUDRAFT_807732 [Hypholoma sublateritium FD-334 SS-4]|uniref:Uncharacterized protein n=1 Tax=Hypholoma sublateritium (strain FD-334 SS-4) TaxID=945553 RepID=A0A0D2Q974_HYPSF|nr:hypothetical protein HYPSUDRAFT_807732 [Hypholoma sublateritium FD-334 SS-4]